MKLTEQILQSYQLRFDELNALKDYIAEVIDALKNGEGYEEVKRKFEECLFWFYVDGFSSGILMIGEDKDIPNGYDFLDIRYPDGETVTEKFEKYAKDGDSARLSALMDSEAHRMYNTGSLNAVGIEVNTENGLPSLNNAEPSGLKKTWMTMGDEKVRDTHWYLEGQTIPLEEEFVTYDGDSALAPSMFSTAQNNAGCRCWLLYSK